jgi:hypothetical protein
MKSISIEIDYYLLPFFIKKKRLHLNTRNVKEPMLPVKHVSEALLASTKKEG